MARHALLALTLFAAPAHAASGPFFSLANTDFIVTLAFLVFVGILIYFGAPAKVTGLLDGRAAQIKSELAEAKALRDEAANLLASYERKKKEVAEQAEMIVIAAKREAVAAAAHAEAELEQSIERRLRAAEEMIEAAQAQAIKDVRQTAITVAIDAASQILAQKMDASGASATIDDGIGKIDKHLN